MLNLVRQGKETFWLNPQFLPFDLTSGLCELVVSDADIAEAEARWQRFAPLLVRLFPETKSQRGVIESPLRAIPKMKQALADTYQTSLAGQLYLKLDSHLPIAGSVKARGGIYEVLKHAEDLAIAAGKLQIQDNYEKLAEPAMRTFFSQYAIQVGSTGNLGLSIGITSAALGFRTIVHMSADARAWKKELLREKGAQVIEYDQDYSQAVAAGRQLSASDPHSYFVDDEKSLTLFLGYAVAGRRLADQLAAQAVAVDAEHPLFVYIPAGVGGAPGGIGYGLKRIFKDHIHLFFVEPTECPSLLLGMASGLYERARVTDFGLSGKTAADGLACASPSGLVTRLMSNLLSGIFTVQDAHLFDLLRLLYESEHIEIEPSSLAAFMGPLGLFHYPLAEDYCREHGLTKQRLAQATHICWATGGSLVPQDIREAYRHTGI